MKYAVSLNSDVRQSSDAAALNAVIFETRQDASSAYYRFLRWKFETLLTPYFQPVLQASRRDDKEAILDDVISLALKVASTVIHKQDPNLSVDNILAELPIDDISQTEIGTSLQILARQFIFAVLGIFGFLYRPVNPILQVPNVTELQIDQIRTTRIPVDHMHFAAACRKSIHSMLRGFGELVPCGSDRRTMESVDNHGSPIYASGLAYYSLFHMSSIRVVWVEVLSEHLLFDKDMLTLRVFRFPSYCVTEYTGALKSSFFHSSVRLFIRHRCTRLTCLQTLNWV